MGTLSIETFPKFGKLIKLTIFIKIVQHQKCQSIFYKQFLKKELEKQNEL